MTSENLCASILSVRSLVPYLSWIFIVTSHITYPYGKLRENSSTRSDLLKSELFLINELVYFTVAALRIFDSSTAGEVHEVA